MASHKFHAEVLSMVNELLKQMDTTLTSKPQHKQTSTGTKKQQRSQNKKQKKQKQQNKQKQQKKQAKNGKSTESPRDPFTQLDIRVGKIHKVWKHNNADSLYVELVDLGEGEGKYRQICTGLVKYVSLEEMQDSEVLVVVNLKPVNMRGVMSYGMLLAAKTEDGQAALVNWPEGSHCGERVSLQDKPIWDHIADREVDGKKKKSAWRKVAPKLRTNAEGIATYDGVPLTTSKGPCFAKFKNAQIS